MNTCHFRVLDTWKWISIHLCSHFSSKQLILFTQRRNEYHSQLLGSVHVKTSCLNFWCATKMLKSISYARLCKSKRIQWLDQKVSTERHMLVVEEYFMLQPDLLSYAIIWLSSPLSANSSSWSSDRFIELIAKCLAKHFDVVELMFYN